MQRAPLRALSPSAGRLNSSRSASAASGWRCSVGASWRLWCARSGAAPGPAKSEARCQNKSDAPSQPHGLSARAQAEQRSRAAFCSRRAARGALRGYRSAAEVAARRALPGPRRALALLHCAESRRFAAYLRHRRAAVLVAASPPLIHAAARRAARSAAPQERRARRADCPAVHGSRPAAPRARARRPRRSCRLFTRSKDRGAASRFAPPKKCTGRLQSKRPVRSDG